MRSRCPRPAPPCSCPPADSRLSALADDGWAVNRTAAGVLIADPKLFPPSAPGANDGLKLVADYIHSKKMKFGIYTARGSRTCLGRPGSDSHEELDARTWAEWGVDYLKEDSCGGVTHGSVWQQYAKMRDALNATGRPIYYSITQGVIYNDGPKRLKMHCCKCSRSLCAFFREDTQRRLRRRRVCLHDQALGCGGQGRHQSGQQLPRGVLQQQGEGAAGPTAFASRPTLALTLALTPALTLATGRLRRHGRRARPRRFHLPARFPGAAHLR